MTTRSPSEVQRALEVTEALEKAERKAPSLDDLKAELGDAVQATVDDNGQVSGKIVGHHAVMRAWQMQTDYHMARSDIAEQRQAGVRRIPMRDRGGRLRFVTEEREDHSAKKHGSRRLIAVSGKRRRLRDGERISGRVPFDFEESA